jgi:biopolymer transport protein ExbD
MAIRLGDGEGDGSDEMHEINVTPFIDVMLVLMIIFMVAAPLATVDVRVELPASTAQPTPRPDKPVFLTIQADLSLSLGDMPVAREALVAGLDTATSHDREQRVFLRADKGVAYGELMQVLNLLRGAGYLRVGLVGLDASQAAVGPAVP